MRPHACHAAGPSRVADDCGTIARINRSHERTGRLVPAAAIRRRRDARLRLVIPTIIAVAFLMEQLNPTIIATTIPDMARSLDTTPVTIAT
jgi:hypothetical protein